MKWKLKIKRFSKKINLYKSLPHIWILFAVTMLGIIMCILSVITKESNTFLSSIFANIFTGILTGVIICLITTIKSLILYITECKIGWLKNLHKECLKFISMHRKLLFSEKGDFKDDEGFYNYIYDTLCYGNDISVTISQANFKETLPFNPYKYCKKEFSFDAVEIMKSNDSLREKIMELDVSKLSKISIRELFKTMEHQIFILNGNVVKEIEILETKKKAINISIG